MITEQARMENRPNREVQRSDFFKPDVKVVSLRRSDELRQQLVIVLPISNAKVYND